MPNFFPISFFLSTTHKTHPILSGFFFSNNSGGFPDYSSFYDPLSSGTNCTRDLPYLQQLGVNAIRVYSVNAAANHDSCMATFSAAGIYLM